MLLTLVIAKEKVFGAEYEFPIRFTMAELIRHTFVDEYKKVKYEDLHTFLESGYFQLYAGADAT